MLHERNESLELRVHFMSPPPPAPPSGAGALEKDGTRVKSLRRRLLWKISDLNREVFWVCNILNFNTMLLKGKYFLCSSRSHYVLEEFSSKSSHSCFTGQALKCYPFFGYTHFCFWKLYMLFFTNNILFPQISAPGDNLIKADPTRNTFAQAFSISLARHHALCKYIWCNIITKNPNDNLGISWQK